jgi:hypothetical protein
VQEQHDIKVVELDKDLWINKKRREFRGIWDQDEVRVPLIAYLCNWSTGVSLNTKIHGSKRRGRGD